MWNKFSTAMPETGRPIIFCHTAFDGDYGDSETVFSSGHVELGMVKQSGFGVTLHRQIRNDNCAEQLSQTWHQEILRNGVWAYQVDVFKTSGAPEHAADENIYFSGERPFEGNVKGEIFNP